MCNFPRDPQRLRTWLINCGMEDKTFNYCAALCKFHFIADMWEDHGSNKKLKSSAEPTIFGELVIQQKHQKITNVSTVSTEIEEESISILTVSVNKEVKIIQNELEITRSPAANVSDREQTTLNTETENYGPDATRNKILHEKSHIGRYS
ncbi:PREDICTED: uncharacterized protein LOC108762508 [Trachymyrmex cornetzi]|uniref:uncharacterized protein LOC108762508 n=1 Tax=Trachymyrmex cornetzi TaxID=471704 RepID=UPI00084EDC49|nr:PREDICTED: uncharacterized protein LOC108762508 [Trachymyrmex cornetzi]